MSVARSIGIMLLVDEIERRQIDHALGLGDAGKVLILIIGIFGIGVKSHCRGRSETHIVGVFVAVHTALVFCSVWILYT